MNHRMSTIFASKTYAADAVEIIDLDVADPISALVFDLQIHNSAAGSMTLHPLASVPKIEIVDGSDVLFALSALEADALQWYNHKGFPSNYNYALAGGYCCRYVHINFGRFLWDPLFAFDPSKFKNPQLKITIDLDGGGLNPTYVKVAVHAMLFDQKMISPTGFLMSKEIKNYTPTGGGHEYTDLPTDYPFRKFLLKCQTAGTEPGQLLTNLKITEDQDKRVIFDHQPDDIIRAVLADYPQVEEDYWFALNTSNRYLMTAPTTRVTAYGEVWAAAAVAQDPAFYDGDGGRLKTIAAANPSNTQIHVRGWLPHGVFMIPFGDQMNPEDWYDVTTIGSLKADINSYAAAAGGIQLFLEQLRSY
jgi:hypothetical protein